MTTTSEHLTDVDRLDYRVVGTKLQWDFPGDIGSRAATLPELYLWAQIERLQQDLARTESAHAVVMAENKHYKQVAADRERALRNCLLLAMRNLHVKHPDSLAAKNWEAILRFCKEGGIEPSPLRASETTGEGQ